MDKFERDFTRDIIAGVISILVFFSGIYCGHAITDAHAERYRTESVNAAVSEALESTRTPLNCPDNEIIEAIKGMATNGSHVKSYKLFLQMDGGEEAWVE